MRLNSLSLLAFLGLAASTASAQSAADDLYFSAYMAWKKAEAADAKGDTRTAEKTYSQVLSTLDQVTQRFPNWSPSVVKYRRERAAEALAKLQAKGPGVGAGTPGRPDENPLEGTPLPERDLLPPDEFPGITPPPRARRNGDGSDSATAPTSGDPITEIQTRMSALKRDLEETRSRLEKATQEKAEAARKLDAAIAAAKESAKKAEVLQSRADRAEKALIDAEKSGTKTVDDLAGLRAEVARAKKQMRELQYERDAEAELREGMTARASAAGKKTEAMTADRDAARNANTEAPRKLAEMQKEIDRVTGEKGVLETRLSNVEKQLLAVTSQRDEAVAQLTKFKEAQKNVDKLLADNTSLMAKLGEAEKQITTLKADGVKKDDDIQRLNAEVTDVRKQLADTQKQSAEYQTQMTDLRKQLEGQAKELAQVKADGTKTVAERDRMVRENELLRGIVLRAQKSQADREQTKKLVLGELARLEVNSKALTSQIELLGSPVVKLSAKEKTLFKQPVLSIGEADISFGAAKENATEPAPAGADATASAEQNEPAPAAPKDAAPAPEALPEGKVADASSTEKPAGVPSVEKDAVPKTQDPAPAAPLANQTPAPQLPEELQPLEGAGKRKPGKGKDDKQASIPKTTKTPALPPMDGDLPVKEPKKSDVTSGPGVRTAAEPAVPAEILGIVREAKEQYERGNYRDAEKSYKAALAKAPNNLYVLSNLGVVYFQAKKFPLAGETFKKAIAIAPEDDFSHCTKGIVEYVQDKLDVAIDDLTKALAINPKNPTAHNYVGITASRKGWQQAALKHLETATQLDPNYADAHFNLAVVFATMVPPDKERAREHYKRAIELGAEADAALEQMLK